MSRQLGFQRSLTTISPMPMHASGGREFLRYSETGANVPRTAVLVGRLVSPAPVPESGDAGERVRESGGEIQSDIATRSRGCRFRGKTGSVAAAVRPRAGIAGGEAHAVRSSRLSRWCSGLGGVENAVTLAASVVVLVAGVVSLLVVREGKWGTKPVTHAGGQKTRTEYVVPASTPVRKPGTDPHDDRIAGVDLSGPF